MRWLSLLATLFLAFVLGVASALVVPTSATATTPVTGRAYAYDTAASSSSLPAVRAPIPSAWSAPNDRETASVAGEISRSSWVLFAAETGPAMTIDDAQFGAKVGKHAQDYGLDPSDPAARSWVRGHIEDIRSSPDEVRQGPWNPKGGGGTDYLLYRQGADVVVTRGGGQFVTVLKGGQSNGWFQDATPR